MGQQESKAADAGAVTPLMVAALGMVVVMLLSLAPVGRALSNRAQARTAADAAALAGAAEGEAAARGLAQANGAELVAFDVRDGEVVVQVEVAGISAYSKARRIGPAVPQGSEGAGDRAGLAPALLAALTQADAALGEVVPITSGYRSPQRQQALWEQRHSNPFPVAPPGRSMHERGLAVDVPSGFVDRLLSVAGDVGLCRPYPVSDPIHFELCGSGD